MPLTPNFWLHAKLGAAQVSTSATWHTDAGQNSSPSESIMRPYYSFGMDFGLVENVKLMAYADWTKGRYKEQVGLHAHDRPRGRVPVLIPQVFK